MAGENLGDDKITNVTAVLSKNDIKKVAVIYMKAPHNEVDNTKGGEASDFRELFRFWRNRTDATVQDLANILAEAQVMAVTRIKKILGVKEIFRHELKPSGEPDLQYWELGWVADKIPADAIDTMSDLGITETDKINIRSDNRGDAWNAKFDILVRWSYKPENSRQVRQKLEKMISNHTKLNRRDFNLVLGEPKSTRGTKRTRSKVDETDAPSTSDIDKIDSKSGTAEGLDAPDASQSDGGNSGTKSEDVRDVKYKTKANGETQHQVVPPGYLLIINNKDFGSKPREGSQTDVEALKGEFEKRGFISILLENLSAKMMIAAVKAFAKKDELKILHKKKAFNKQFQLHHDEIMEELEEFFNDLRNDPEKETEEAIKEFADTFLLNFEDAEEFENGFESSRRETLKNRFMVRLDRKQTLNFENVEENIGRKAFANKYKLRNIKELDNLITRYKTEAKTPLIDTGCLVLALMSHGNRGTIQGIDGKRVEIDALLNEFNTDNCPSLAGKEKMFLIQACRGPDRDTVQEDDPGASTEEAVFDFREVEAQVVPRYADTIAGYATNYGLKALRYALSGSVFIQRVCDVIEEFGDDTDVLTMTTEINKRVGAEKHEVRKEPDRPETIEVVQMCEFHHTLRKKWFLPKRK